MPCLVVAGNTAPTKVASVAHGSSPEEIEMKSYSLDCLQFRTRDVEYFGVKCFHPYKLLTYSRGSQMAGIASSIGQSRTV